MRTALFLFLASLLPAHASIYPGLWLKLSDEMAPAGGVVQIRLTLTEPKPIIRTRAVISFDETVVEDILGVAVFSENGEAAGTALRFGNQMLIEIASPTANFGTAEGLPLLSLSARLRSNAPAGASSVFRLHPDSQFFEEDGEMWKIEDNAPGVLRVAGDLSIDEVIPSGGFVYPGQTVSILGRGFRASTLVAIDGKTLPQAEVVSPFEIRFTVDALLQLDQREIRVIDRGSAEQSLFATLRGRDPSSSAYDLLAATTPLFSPRVFTVAHLQVPEVLEEPSSFAGLALQNPHGRSVEVRIQAVRPDGEPLGVARFTLHAHERVVRHLAELFPQARSLAGLKLQLEADASIQGMGLEGHYKSGAILPLLPEPLP